jgi:GNAT superfamily N-acetyltransferase
VSAELEQRSARHQDLSSIAELVARCSAGYGAWAPGGWSAPDDIATREREYLMRHLGDSSARIVVTLRRGQLAGFHMWKPSWRTAGAANLARLFVDPAAWGAGIGRQLLLAAERAMRHAALRLYERNGWQPTGELLAHASLRLEMRRYRRRLGTMG